VYQVIVKNKISEREPDFKDGIPSTK